MHIRYVFITVLLGTAGLGQMAFSDRQQVLQCDRPLPSLVGFEASAEVDRSVFGRKWIDTMQSALAELGVPGERSYFIDLPLFDLDRKTTKWPTCKVSSGPVTFEGDTGQGDVIVRATPARLRVWGWSLANTPYDVLPSAPAALSSTQFNRSAETWERLNPGLTGDRAALAFREKAPKHYGFLAPIFGRVRGGFLPFSQIAADATNSCVESALPLLHHLIVLTVKREYSETTGFNSAEALLGARQRVPDCLRELRN